MDSVPTAEVKIGEKSPSKVAEKKEIYLTSNNPQEEVKESISLNETEIRTKKIIKIQEENKNGNYGKIIIQESSSNRDRDKFNSNSPKGKGKALQEKEIKTKTIISNTNNNKNDNNKRNRVISVDNKYMRKNEGEKNTEKKYNLRRKSINRGGDYKNIQVTHIIYSTRTINFHIIDPLMSYTDEMRRKYMNKIDNKNRNGRNGRVKVSYNCSCDNIRIRPKEKSNLKGKTIVVSHRQNIKVEKNINDDKKRIKERKEGKEGKDSIIKISVRNKNENTGNKGNSGGGMSASYKKRNQKSNNNNVNINIKKIN